MEQTPQTGRLPAERSPAPRAPLLPRTLDTRMPPAPAPGGKVISVGRPKAPPRKAELDAGMLLGALGIAVVAAVGWRLMRRHVVRHRLL
jgi:hypothetical protein